MTYANRPKAREDQTHHILTNLDGEATLLHYNVRANIGGKIAQLGARLIDSAAKRLAAEFFTRLSDVIGEAEGARVPA
jgi:carbon monoxide dehydrogenase subunit G